MWDRKLNGEGHKGGSDVLAAKLEAGAHGHWPPMQRAQQKMLCLSKGYGCGICLQYYLKFLHVYQLALEKTLYRGLSLIIVIPRRAGRVSDCSSNL